ncbi:MAG: YegS/Rv2252/BmrU family lipid kinase [Dehalococcoidia bacterium]
MDTVFVVGGDGSLRAVAAGLVGTTTAVAPVPAGTVNVFAREAGIPRGVRKAFDGHLGGQVCPVDLGLTSSGERFLLMASIGWDAAIAASTSMRLKGRFGDKAYILEALRRIPFLRTSPARWSAGDEHHDRRLAMMVISNTRLYGGRVVFSPGAVANDGLLDLCALCPGGPKDAIRLALKLARSRLVGDPAVVNTRATRVSVETAGLAVQLDGDPIGHTPMDFSVEPGALLVSLPAGARPAILP